MRQVGLRNGESQATEKNQETLRLEQKRQDFEALVQENAYTLYNFAAHLCDHGKIRKQDTEDIVQEALQHAWQGFCKFEGRSKFTTWMYVIIRRCYLDKLEEIESMRRREDGYINHPSYREKITGSYHRPEAVLMSQELRARIMAAIARLPSEVREAFVMKILEGLSYDQISEKLGITDDQLRGRLYRARRDVKEALNSEGPKNGKRVA